MVTETQTAGSVGQKHWLKDLTLKDGIAALFAATAIFLLGLNLYGEVRTMRVVDNVPAEDFLFENDITLDMDETFEQIERRPGETELQFATRLNTVVQKSLGHLATWRDADPDTYPQRVPMRENIWLNIMSYLVTDPEVVKYHFANYKKTLERGIAICGDHSYMVSQILWDNDIPNSILVYQPHEDHLKVGGHVAVEVRPEGDKPYILDPDFGVSYPKVDDAASVEDKYAMTNAALLDAGYDARRSDLLADIMTGRYVEWENTFDIMKKRFIFEKTTYVLKWLVPAMLLLLAFALSSRLRKKVLPF